MQCKVQIMLNQIGSTIKEKENFVMEITPQLNTQIRVWNYSFFYNSSVTNSGSTFNFELSVVYSNPISPEIV